MAVNQKSLLIWNAYRFYAGTGLVMRKGYEHSELARKTEMPFPVAEGFFERGESVLEHQAKVAFLSSVFMENYPEFFRGEHGYEGMSYAILTALFCHDIGEVLTGDIMDDGNPAHAAKDKIESEAFKKLMLAHGRNGKEISRMFREFQDKNTHVGKAMYALDKVEAVLNLLYLEQYGCYGRLDKKEFPTAMDRYFMRETETVCTTDCWAAHSRALMQGFPEEITEPVFNLLQTAVMDVRGGSFPWWDKNIPMPTEEDLS